MKDNNLETITLDEIKPTEYNPRQITPEQLKQLNQNIQKFGLVDPIIINLKNNHIIGGHQRYQILKQEQPDTPLHLLRLGDIGWAFTTTNLTLQDEADEKALNIALNNLSGEFQNDKLAELLEDLIDIDYDVSLTGFMDHEVYDIILNNEQLTLQDEDDGSVDDSGELLVFNDAIQDETVTLNIQLHSDKQRQQLIQLVSKLKTEHPDKSIAQNLTMYIQQHLDTTEQKVQPYTVIFEDQQEKEQFMQAYNKLQNHKRYMNNPILQLQTETQEDE